MTTDSTSRPAHSPSIEADEYYNTALQWFLYPTWTIDEAANLLTGCLPKREMFQPGEHNAKIDQNVLETENHIRRALGGSLEAASSKKYFAPIEIQHEKLIQWATRQDLILRESLLTAFEHAQRERVKYTTPCLEAIEWTREHFWRNADFRDPPTKGVVIQALLQAFADLDHEECIMVEYMCRHPLTRN
jgi:hypothetical protein